MTEIALDEGRPPVLRFNSGECVHLSDEYTVNDLEPALRLLAMARGVAVPNLMHVEDSGPDSSSGRMSTRFPTPLLDKLFDGRQRSGIPGTLHRWA
jgi:hypothetical protein